MHQLILYGRKTNHQPRYQCAKRVQLWPFLSDKNNGTTEGLDTLVVWEASQRFAHRLSDRFQIKPWNRHCIERIIRNNFLQSNGLVNMVIKWNKNDGIVRFHSFPYSKNGELGHYSCAGWHFIPNSRMWVNILDLSKSNPKFYIEILIVRIFHDTVSEYIWISAHPFFGITSINFICIFFLVFRWFIEWEIRNLLSKYFL